jgi:hypothetical protein
MLVVFVSTIDSCLSVSTLRSPFDRRARATGAAMPTRVEKSSTPEDGFQWRKYGQKEILNSKYPRSVRLFLQESLHKIHG